MAQSDFGFPGDNISSAFVLSGVTAGVTPPNGGGSFVYGFNSIAAASGASILYDGETGFAPAAKGTSVHAAIKRGVSGGATNFSPYIFCGLVTNSVASKAYLLGLSDQDPHQITLVKGAPTGGVPGVAPPTSGVLIQGTETWLNNTWLHIRLDMISNTNGDVVLNMFRNDLTANPVTAPVWVPLAGANQFIDDALGINSGSAPLVSGYAGFGYTTKDITRRAFFDQIVIGRQL